MYRNDLRLVGRVENTFKEGKTQNGDDYIWFLLNTEPKENATSTENNYNQKINIMCFKKHVIDYLKRVKLKSGNIVIIFGFISSFKFDVKGKEIISNAVNANEIYIVKTKASV